MSSNPNGNPNDDQKKGKKKLKFPWFLTLEKILIGLNIVIWSLIIGKYLLGVYLAHQTLRIYSY